MYHKTRKGGGTHPLDIHLGLQLRKLRKLKGLSQQDLGKRIDLTFQQIQKYEKGANHLSCSRLYDIAQVLGVSIFYFFEEYQTHGSEEAMRNASSSFLLNTKGMLQLTQLYSQLESDPLQKAFLHLLRAVVKDCKTEDTP